MLRSVLPATLAAAFLCLSAPVSGAVTASTVIPAVRAANAPAFDAGHPGASWSAAELPAAGGFESLTTRSKARLPTRVWLTYDSANVYVAFTADQTGTPITASQSTNDVGFGIDDFVGIGIDTSGVGSQIYFFEATPRGVRYEQASDNVRYRPQWQAAAAVHGSTWTALFVIPLRALRIHPGARQTWRINFIRNIAASAEHYTWAYDGLMQDGPTGSTWPDFTQARFWAQWSGIAVDRSLLSSAKPKPRLELFGLESGGRDRDVFQQANGTFAPSTVRTDGLDVSYPITQTINFVGTLNPDFSNVEIDQQTIAPQEFRRQLQEYRPFFTQGASFLNPNTEPITSSQIFYSPSVGPFDRGEKVEGSFGDQAFGVLNFRGFDDETGNTFDDTAYGYKHALGDRTFLYWADGVEAHHSLFGNDSTNEAGVAGRNLHTGFVWGIDAAQERGSLQWLPTGTAYNEGAFVDVHKPNYEVYFSESDISPDYNPIDGFTPNSDVRGPTLFTNVSGSMPGVRNFTINADVDRYFDLDGQVHQSDFDVNLNATFDNKFSLDGIGFANGSLRSYALSDPASAGTTCANPSLARSYFTGFPRYYCGRNDAYFATLLPVGYGDGTPTPVDATVSFGRFGNGLTGPGDGSQDYVHLYTLSTSRPIARNFSLGLEYDGTFERQLSGSMSNSQWLRRVSIGTQLGTDSNLTISLRGINGTGGFALPGNNLAFAYHRRFSTGDLFINFGTPASPYTLDRTIVKYVLRFGADSGT